MTHKGFDHSNSIILHGIEKIYEHTRNPAYIRSFADSFIMTVPGDGSPQITSVAPAMGCKKSYEEYVAVRPVSCPSNDAVQHPHGYCAVLIAASVMEYSAAPF